VAINTTDQNAPENNLDNPNIEKNAALNATKNAVAPTNVGNFLNDSNI